MILIERSGHVAAPTERVWEVVRHAEQMPSWRAGVQQAEVLSDEGFGQRLRVQYSRGAVAEADVIAYRAPTLVAWRERSAGAPVRGLARTEVHVELAQEREGTAVRLIYVQWPAGPLRGVLLRLVRGRRVAADLERSLARLAELTTLSKPEQESSPAPAGSDVPSPAG